jgi:signal transduction histidine kinase
MNDDEYAELFKKPEQRSSGGATWADVANEFQTLGETLGDAVRAAWQRNESNQHVRELQDSLNSIMEGVAQAIDGGITTPEAKQARDQLEKCAESIRQATEQASKDLRPELISMLRQANAELRRFSDLDKE